MSLLLLKFRKRKIKLRKINRRKIKLENLIEFLQNNKVYSIVKMLYNRNKYLERIKNLENAKIIILYNINIYII